MRIASQVAIVYAAVNGFIDSVPLDKVQEFEKELHSILNAEYMTTLDNIESKKVLDDEIKSSLDKAIKDCQKLFVEN